MDVDKRRIGKAEAAQKGGRKVFDIHTHSYCSDGADAPAVVVEKLRSLSRRQILKYIPAIHAPMLNLHYERLDDRFNSVIRSCLHP